MDDKSTLSEDLKPIPGDTYALRAELKALGAVWDPAGRLWRITDDKLALATALVEHHSLIPEAPLLRTDDSGEPIDPFEQDDDPALIALEKRDGATYDARDTLRAVGAKWDKNRRAWMIREERADYARAVLASVAGSAIPAPSAPLRSPEPEQEQETAPIPARQTVKPTPPPTPTSPLVVREPRQETYAISKDTAAKNTTAQETTQPMAADRIKLGGLWLNRSKDGREYLTGKLSPTVKILIFKNDFKNSENQPSHVMYLAPVEQEESARPNTAAPDSFFGIGDDTESAFSGGGVADDDFFPEEDAAPLPPPTPRPARSAPASNTRPTTGNRPATASSSPPTRRPNAAPPPSRTPNRNPQPSVESTELENFEDPFAD